MPKVTVYKVKLYNVITDETHISRRTATQKGPCLCAVTSSRKRGSRSTQIVLSEARNGRNAISFPDECR